MIPLWLANGESLKNTKMFNGSKQHKKLKIAKFLLPRYPPKILFKEN